MNERTKKIITAIVVIVIFVVCIGPVSYTHLRAHET